MREETRERLFFIGVMVFTISLQLALDYLNVKDENIYLVFVLAILVTIIETRNIYYGILGSVIFVLSFNFFITEPKFTFVVDDTNNYVSFAMFMLVTFLVNSLVRQLQKQIAISRENERKVQTLYKISSDFLHINNRNEIYLRALADLQEYLDGEVTILSEEGTLYGKEADLSELRAAIAYVERCGYPITPDSNEYPAIAYCIYPIKSPLRTYGVILREKEAYGGSDESEFLKNIIEEMIVVLDKIYIATEQEETKIQVENEKFKTSLLRGLSHDIRTPLTVIQSGSNLLSESFDDIDNETKKELIQDIYDESCDLSSFVENLLDMTRLDNENVQLVKVTEAVEDVLFSVHEKVKRRLNDKELTIRNTEERLNVYADTRLLTQVLVNLVDNAIVHTKEHTHIWLSYRKAEEGIEFCVEDDGGGIEEEKLPYIFDNFYSISENQDRKRTHGLGLSICKAIVEAHGGKIWAGNNEKGGTTFRFLIP